MLHAMAIDGKRRSRNAPSAPGVAERGGQARTPMAKLQSAYGNQALLRSTSRAETSGATLQRKCSCAGGAAKCPECEEKEKEGTMQRKAAGPAAGVPRIVHEVLRSPGSPLDRGTREFMGPRFGHDFSQVRVHTDAKAAESARAVNALAYTVGRDIVFGHGQYAPDTAGGRQLMAHELTHTIQQGVQPLGEPRAVGSENDDAEHEADRRSSEIIQREPLPGVGGQETAAGVLQRTPAGKVSCAKSAPLKLPGGGSIDDPVGVITTAENRANALLDQAISELDYTRKQIIGGATIGFPTVSDALGFGLRLMALDPNSEKVWKQADGVGTAALLLKRLRLIRGTIGEGSFFFTCLGPQSGNIGTCAGPICANAVAVSCPGSFLMDSCEPFWTGTPEDRAARIVHESAHNFANFIGDERHVGEGVAECYARFAQTVGGSNVANQRTDLCPDPT
jgi:hypothetical protein